MYHVEYFNSKGKPGEMEALLKQVLSYWRCRGFEVKVYQRQYSLGPKEFCLVTKMEEIGDMDDWAEKAQSEPDGQALMIALTSMVSDIEAGVYDEIALAE